MELNGFDLFVSCLIRFLTLSIWAGALAVYIRSFRIYPIEERAERGWFAAILMSFIVHVIVFYAMQILKTMGIVDWPMHAAMWSNILRIHGGVAILSDGVIHNIRFKLLRRTA